MQIETWEQEVAALHRWGQHGEARVQQELARSRALWNAAQPVSGNARRIIEQTVALEICNWNLEESVLALCKAIGTNEPAQLPIGHLASVSEDRWRMVWAYHAALCDWLPGEGGRGYPTLLSWCDPGGGIRSHVRAMLGDRSELKELYVERLCLCLQRWLRGHLPSESAFLKGHVAATRELESEIEKRDADGTTLDAMRMDGDGRLQPCSHKAFRRYDIIISSIGCGKWRGAMPTRGTDGIERADLLASYLDPMDAWVKNGQQAAVTTTPAVEVLSRLGTPDERKRFLASLLVSLLRAQEIAARKRAESRLTAQN